MDSETVYNDVIRAIAKIIFRLDKLDWREINLDLIPKEDPPDGLGAKRVGAWGEVLSRIGDHLAKLGYNNLDLEKSAKKTYTESLQFTALLIVKIILGQTRISTSQLKSEAELLSALQARYVGSGGAHA